MPTQHRAIQSRQALIRSAAETFLEKGVPAAGMVEISRRARLSKGALYFHFTSKDDLTLAVRDAALATLQEIEDGFTRSPEPLRHRRTGLHRRAVRPGGVGRRTARRTAAAAGDRAGARHLRPGAALVRALPRQGGHLRDRRTGRTRDAVGRRTAAHRPAVDVTRGGPAASGQRGRGRGGTGRPSSACGRCCRPRRTASRPPAFRRRRSSRQPADPAPPRPAGLPGPVRGPHNSTSTAPI